MGLRHFWRKYKDWFAVFICISVLAGYTVWYLHLNPQHIPLFLTTTIIALGFVAVMALLPKHRRRLVNGILEYHVKGKELGGWLYRYQKIALVLFFLIVFAYPIVWEQQLVPSQYIPFFVLTFFVIAVALGVVQIAGLLKVAGKWGLLLIAILSAIAVLRILLWRLAG